VKLHSDVIQGGGITAALWIAKELGHVARDIELVTYRAEGSRSRRYGFHVQLGTSDQSSVPTKSRRPKNSGQYGADRVWAATHDEWGWFTAVLFSMDSNAVFGPYKGRDDFNRQTGNLYTLPSLAEV
jgi:hypothetical protein